MIARINSDPQSLVVVFERDGEKPIRVEVINGTAARRSPPDDARKAPSRRLPEDRDG
jgi:hypothetical protein